MHPYECFKKQSFRFRSMLSLAERVYYQLYQRQRRRFASLPPTRIAGCKIVSVGNITTGGTGKTPMVQWLARHMQGRGARVAVVARGYGGSLSQAGAVVSDGRQILLDAREAGDEPLLHARSLPGVPVVIGRDRVAAARRAAQEFGANVLVLDDGFQYWSLGRDLDIVLLDARRPLHNGRLLPRGRLREPPSELSRAHALVLTRADRANDEQRSAARRQLARWTSAPIYEACHAPTTLRDEKTRRDVPLDALRDARVCALSALADNAAFAATLRGLGASVVEHLARRDHHPWRTGELQNAANRALSAGAAAVVTTQKDAVKIEVAWPQPPPVPLWSLAIEIQMSAGEDDLRALIERRIFETE